MSTYKEAQRRYYQKLKTTDALAMKKRRDYAREYQRKLRERQKLMKYFCNSRGYKP